MKIMSILIYTAECLPGCHNGGACLIPGFCVCPPGWSGDRCEIGIIKKTTILRVELLLPKT